MVAGARNPGAGRFDLNPAPGLTGAGYNGTRPHTIGPRSSSHPNSRVTASALTSSRGWFRWFMTIVAGSMAKAW